jgi:type I restriction enzyme S subunit
LSAGRTELGTVATFIRGVSFKPDQVAHAPSDDVLACMRTSNIQSLLDLRDVWYIPSTIVKRGDQHLHAGDVLVSTANSWNLVGKCCWVPNLPHPATFGGFVSVLRADTTKLDPRYMYWWLSSPPIQYALRSFGRQTTNISNLDIRRCLNLSIPLPSLREQRQIAKLLDAADMLRKKRSESITRLPDLIASLFARTLSASVPRQTLASVSSVTGEYGAGVSSVPFDGTRPRYIRITDIAPGGHLNDERVSPAGEPRAWRAKSLADGDVLFARSGATVGKAYLHRAGSEPSVFAGYLIRFRVDPSRLKPEYLMAYTLTSEYLGWVASQQRTVAQPNINAKQYGSLCVPVPATAVQDEFVASFRAVEYQHSLTQRHLVQLNALFVALQARALKGEL